MIVIKNRNVNSMFTDGLRVLSEIGERAPSRAGDVIVMPCPVMSVYTRPMERVLFNAGRDANPFFHLMESLWMLAGRNDSKMLDRYVSNFGERFADKGHIHGAYGHRWRTHFGFDQLDKIVLRLRADPNDRQCVLQMWDATPCHVAEQSRGDIGDSVDGEDIWVGADDLRGAWKDRPCNTHVYFRVRRVHVIRGGEQTYDDVLDMTVCCRSNDVVWGAYGANAVHFSVLMEYMAGRIGCDVGIMYQLSNNYHGYVDVLDKIGGPEMMLGHDPYDDGAVSSEPMGTHWNSWDDDLHKFMEWHDDMDGGVYGSRNYVNQWFSTVAETVAATRWNWTHGFKPSARAMANTIEASDWRVACTEWMDRRAAQ